jgi:hypothetical protein
LFLRQLPAAEGVFGVRQVAQLFGGAALPAGVAQRAAGPSGQVFVDGLAAVVSPDAGLVDLAGQHGGAGGAEASDEVELLPELGGLGERHVVGVEADHQVRQDVAEIGQLGERHPLDHRRPPSLAAARPVI